MDDCQGNQTVKTFWSRKDVGAWTVLLGTLILSLIVACAKVRNVSGTSCRDLESKYVESHEAYIELKEELATSVLEVEGLYRKALQAYKIGDCQEAKELLAQAQEILDEYRSKAKRIEPQQSFRSDDETTRDAVPKISANAEWGFFKIFVVDPRFDRTLGDIAVKTPGVKWTRITRRNWDEIEPRPPMGGQHHYNWEATDWAVRIGQKYDVNIVFVLHPTNRWARDRRNAKKYNPLFHYPPSDRYLEYWTLFVRNVIERYDLDGYKDMPGLTKAFRWWQIGNEYSGRFWRGSVNDYLQVLRYAYEAKELADHDAEIILGGIALPDRIARFRRFGSYREKSKKFNETLLQHPEYFDAIDLHFMNYLGFNPGAISAGVNWAKNAMRKNSYEKPMYALEWTAAFGHFDYPNPKWFDENILRVLENSDASDYLKTRNAFEGEQATDFAKMFVSLLAHGLKRLIYVPFHDFSWPATLWNTQGLVRVDKATRMVTGLKPAYHTYKLLNSKLSGFSSVEILSTKTPVHVFKFKVRERDVFFAWSDKPGERLNSSILFGDRKKLITHIISDVGEEEARVERTELPFFILGVEPVFIEPIR